MDPLNAPPQGPLNQHWAPLERYDATFIRNLPRPESAAMQQWRARGGPFVPDIEEPDEEELTQFTIDGTALLYKDKDDKVIEWFDGGTDTPYRIRHSYAAQDSHRSTIYHIRTIPQLNDVPGLGLNAITPEAQAVADIDWTARTAPFPRSGTTRCVIS